jgi:hypothetical protein
MRLSLPRFLGLIASSASEVEGHHYASTSFSSLSKSLSTAAISFCRLGSQRVGKMIEKVECCFGSFGPVGGRRRDEMR